MLVLKLGDDLAECIFMNAVLRYSTPFRCRVCGLCGTDGWTDDKQHSKTYDNEVFRLSHHQGLSTNEQTRSCHGGHLGAS